MTPSEYKALYDKLPVPKKDGTPDTVRLNQYRLASMNLNVAALDAFQAKFYKHGIDMELCVQSRAQTITLNKADVNVAPVLKINTGMEATEQVMKNFGVPVDLSEQNAASQRTRVGGNIVADWATLTRLPFKGKGAPEHCQIVLQLAAHWGLAPQGLQAYADAALGLDCNGFVGNYLRHGLRGIPWNSLGLNDIDGPDTRIDGYFDKYAKHNTYLSRWEEFVPGCAYIMGRTNKSGIVIPQKEGSEYAHIVISEPGNIQQVISLALPFGR